MYLIMCTMEYLFGDPEKHAICVQGKKLFTQNTKNVKL